MLTPEEIFDRTETLIELAVKREAKRIDACNCQTRRDWEDYHEAEEKLEEAREAFRKDLGLPG